MPRYIDADKLRDYFTSLPPDWYHTQQITNKIDEQSAADVRKERYGVWVVDYNYHTRCSECKYLLDKYEREGSFCPNCGAYMNAEVKLEDFY